MSIIFESPSKEGYTIYSKSGCPNCTKVKKLLETNHITATQIIDCDDYLIESKEEFLQFIYDIIGKEYRTFPMVFYNGTFIGGYTETNVFLQKETAFNEMVDF